MFTRDMCCEIVSQHVDQTCNFDSSSSAFTKSTTTSEPTSLVDPLVYPHLKDETPLYTEINIPLPAVPAPTKEVPQTLSPPPRSRSRAVSLSSLSPFRRRSSSVSSPVRASEDWPRIRKEVKNKEVAAMMNPDHQNKRSRSGTIDALAVVPAVLVLSAELFTPGQASVERRKDSGVGRWEDGIR